MGTDSLHHIGKMIDALQMVVHLPIMKIVIPPNVMFCFMIMLPFVMFDIVETEYTTEKILEFDYDAQEKASNGYSS